MHWCVKHEWQQKTSVVRNDSTHPHEKKHCTPCTTCNIYSSLYSTTTIIMIIIIMMMMIMVMVSKPSIIAISSSSTKSLQR